MTLIERSPNLIFASKIVGKLFANKDHVDQHDLDAEIDADGAVEELEEVPAENDNDENPDFFGDQATAFRLTKLIAAADEESARIIGIAGARLGAGASLTSRQLAGAYASFGRDTLLIDASEIPPASDAQRDAPTASLLRMADEVRPSLSFVALGSVIGDASLSPEDYAKTLKSQAQAGRTIVIDLPPIVTADGAPNTIIRDLGAACDLVFLVCPTGEMVRKELSECVETCKVVGLELNGLILNDWQLPGSDLLES